MKRLSSKKAKMSIGLSLATLLLAACGSTGGASAATSTTGTSTKSLTTIRIALNNTSASLPVYVAEKEGFFTKVGLTAQSTTLSDITKILPGLGKQYDIGFSVQPLLIRAVSQGLPVQQISGNEQTSTKNPGVMLVTKKGAKLTSAQDLVGKRLAAPTLTGNIHLGTLYWLKSQGVNPNSVTSVQVATPAMIDQLKAGLIYAAEMQQPFINYAVSQGLQATVYPLSAVGNPTYLSAWAANSSWASKNVTSVNEFKQALNDSYKWISDNPSAARTLLAQFTHLPANVIKGSPFPDFTTQNSVSSVQQWGKVLQSVAGFTAPVNFSQMVFQPSSNG